MFNYDSLILLKNRLITAGMRLFDVWSKLSTLAMTTNIQQPLHNNYNHDPELYHHRLNHERTYLADPQTISRYNHLRGSSPSTAIPLPDNYVLIPKTQAVSTTTTPFTTRRILNEETVSASDLMQTFANNKKLQQQYNCRVYAEEINPDNNPMGYGCNGQNDIIDRAILPIMSKYQTITVPVGHQFHIRITDNASGFCNVVFLLQKPDNTIQCLYLYNVKPSYVAKLNFPIVQETPKPTTIASTPIIPTTSLTPETSMTTDAFTTTPEDPIISSHETIPTIDPSTHSQTPTIDTSEVTISFKTETATTDKSTTFASLTTETEPPETQTKDTNQNIATSSDTTQSDTPTDDPNTNNNTIEPDLDISSTENEITPTAETPTETTEVISDLKTESINTKEDITSSFDMTQTTLQDTPTDDPKTNNNTIEPDLNISSTENEIISTIKTDTVATENPTTFASLTTEAELSETPAEHTNQNIATSSDTTQSDVTLVNNDTNSTTNLDIDTHSIEDNTISTTVHETNDTITAETQTESAPTASDLKTENISTKEDITSSFDTTQTTLQDAPTDDAKTDSTIDTDIDINFTENEITPATKDETNDVIDTKTPIESTQTTLSFETENTNTNTIDITHNSDTVTISSSSMATETLPETNANTIDDIDTTLHDFGTSETISSSKTVPEIETSHGNSPEVNNTNSITTTENINTILTDKEIDSSSSDELNIVTNTSESIATSAETTTSSEVTITNTIDCTTLSSSSTFQPYYTSTTSEILEETNSDSDDATSIPQSEKTTTSTSKVEKVFSHTGTYLLGLATGIGLRQLTKYYKRQKQATVVPEQTDNNNLNIISYPILHVINKQQIQPNVSVNPKIISTLPENKLGSRPRKLTPLHNRPEPPLTPCNMK